jgi:SHS2 domain-containing protein
VYRWVDHTSELELHVEADSEAEVYGEATRALGELLGGDELTQGEREARELEVAAPDRPALLAAWLEELVFLAESERIVPDGAEPAELSETRVRGVVRGRRGDPRPLVKAVTYHRLSFEPADGAWRATVVLDV